MKKTALYLLTGAVVLGCNNKPEPAPGRGANLTIYPNPTAHGASIEVGNTNGQPYRLLVFDPKGKMILQRSASPAETRHNLPLQNQPKGNYQVIVDSPAGVARQKLVKL
jgi:hypothetical protein